MARYRFEWQLMCFDILHRYELIGPEKITK
jgi:hypothetical protein